MEKREENKVGMVERVKLSEQGKGARGGMEARAFERYGLLSGRPSNQHCQLVRVETGKGGQ
jgi:hypothetical protein